jgi:hypothetical protein
MRIQKKEVKSVPWKEFFLKTNGVKRKTGENKETCTNIYLTRVFLTLSLFLYEYCLHAFLYFAVLERQTPL